MAEYSGYVDKKKDPFHKIRCLCFSPDGRYLVVGNGPDEMIHVSFSLSLLPSRLLMEFLDMGGCQ
jgi:WD40 repeat protein